MLAPQLQASAVAIVKCFEVFKTYKPTELIALDMVGFGVFG